MIILSHRGYWLSPQEKNTRAAFERSFGFGFGTETDVRDAGGRLVISHDPPTGGEMSLEEFLALLPDPELPLAMNVKADGLAKPLLAAMQAAGHRHWFAFDMSIPDTIMQLRAGVPVYTRLSDHEPEALLLDQAQGIWLDSFGPEWWDRQTVEHLLATGKRVCVVSSELHGRDTTAAWQVLRPLAGHPNLMLCTDVPEKAQAYFKEA
ncbi:PI-PLC domain-containing protein [Rhodovarius lipocyclicus]|uniref:phosphodiesterase n=1 Tax=Rhodovarius lipocyclicus TaxID=268410 RepID=UPI001356FC36|nr:phosphodiesterase [Rhodovarius lipocyclicus]